MLIPWVLLAIENDSDREFMEKLYIHHSKTMFRVARASTESLHEAEDAVSDACLSLIRAISVLKRLEQGALEGYIVSTVRNAAYALHRKKKGLREVSASDEILLNTLTDGHTPDEGILNQCRVSELMEAIGRLSDADQIALRMKYFHKNSDEEIAGILGVQAISVRSRLTRARRRIYSILAGEQHE